MVKKNEAARDSGLFAVGDRIGRLLIGPGMTVRSLEIFLIVAHRGSMSAAAQYLGLSQPAISQAVMGMEAALNVQLFDRSARPPALTLQATALLAPAQAVIESLRDFENVILRGKMSRLPSLRIGMTNSFAASVGPTILGHLREIAAELRVESGFRATRIQALANRDYDFIVTADESPLPPNIEILPLLTEPFLLVLPVSYKGDKSDLVRLSEDLEFIGSGRDPIMLSRFERTLQSRGVALRSQYHLDTVDAVLQMVAKGVGWSIQPPSAVYRALARGEAIQVVGYPDDALKRVIVVAFRAGEQRVARQIQAAALNALKREYLPKVKALLPTVFRRIQLHKS